MLLADMAFPDDIDPASPGPHDQMKLGFAVWIAKLIADANGVLDLSEIRILNKRFPNDLLRKFELVDDMANPTETFKRVSRQAVGVLPGVMTLDEKLELVTVFHEVCLADQQLAQSELLILREASEALGVPVRVLSSHLSSLRQA
jgi:uncharacterized tellurite resistance protein B-like protein